MENIQRTSSNRRNEHRRSSSRDECRSYVSTVKIIQRTSNKKRYEHRTIAAVVDYQSKHTS
jgi:hypothetical protein